MENDKTMAERRELEAIHNSGHTSVTDHEHEKSTVIEKDHAYRAGHNNVEAGNPLGLSQEHVAYLMARHGTIDLNPLPTMDPADPLNWPSWKVSHMKTAMRQSFMHRHQTNTCCRKMSTSSLLPLTP